MTTGVLFCGMGAAVATAEDMEGGVVDRLRSLPIPRSSVLAARAIADTAILAWTSVITVASRSRSASACTAARRQGAAFPLVLVYGFAFEWLFITMGLLAGTGQAAQGHGDDRLPPRVRVERLRPVATMPGWLQVFAKHQPLTDMVDAVRGLTLGSRAQVELGHPSSYYVTRSLIWAAAILAAAVPLAVAKYQRS